MLSPQEGAVREAVLDLALSAVRGDLTHEAIAARAGVPVRQVRENWADIESLILMALQPLHDAVNDILLQVPIRKQPDMREQRELLEALLSVSLRYPRHNALEIRVLTSEGSSLTDRIDQFAYQLGVRLLGLDYESKPDFITRTYFLCEMVSLTTGTHRHDLTDAATRSAIIDSMLAVINPQAMQTSRPPTLRRRWTDEGPQHTGGFTEPTNEDQIAAPVLPSDSL